MKAGQKARQDALNRVQWFLGEHSAAVGVVNQSKTRLALDDLVKELAARAADQHAAEVAATSRTDRKDELREELRLHHMQPISEIARAKLAGTPDITKLRLPARRTDDAALVAAGDAMAQIAVQYRQVFLDEQLPQDFVEQLQAATDAVRNAVIQRDGARNQVRVATAAMEHRLTVGLSLVRILNGLVVKQLRAKPELHEGWKQAKHPKAKPGVPRGTTRAEEPATTPVPAANEPTSTQPAPQPAAPNAA